MQAALSFDASPVWRLQKHNTPPWCLYLDRKLSSSAKGRRVWSILAMCFSLKFSRLWTRNDVAWNLEIAGAKSLDAILAVWVFLWTAILNLLAIIRTFQILAKLMLLCQLLGSCIKPPLFHALSFFLPFLYSFNNTLSIKGNVIVQLLPEVLFWNFCYWIFSSLFIQVLTYFLSMLSLKAVLAMFLPFSMCHFRALSLNSRGKDLFCFVFCIYMLVCLHIQKVFKNIQN